VLDATQRRLWHLLTAPEGVAAALREAGDPDGRSLAGFVASDARLDATSRLEVYANAYFTRLHAVLCDDFGALAAAIGDAWMNDVVAAYLLAHPPRLASIRHAGAELPDFLTAHPAALPFRRRFPWCADLARLEHALGDAFDAADVPLRTRESLATLPPEAWTALLLPLAPCVRVLRLDWPVLALREAYEREETQPAPRAAPEANAALVWRRDELVRFRPLEPLEAELLERADAGECFEALCEAAAREIGESDAPARAAQLLAGWIEAGVIAA